MRIRQGNIGAIDEKVMPQAPRPLRNRNKDQARELARQALFQKVANEVLRVPDGYLEVTVLIIRWDKTLDDFQRHEEEIDRLKSIFQSRFNYTCEEHQITNHKNPQISLDLAIYNFVDQHDDLNNLLVVYYTGHGMLQKNGKLALTANEILVNPGPRHSPFASWEQAERPLRDLMEGDALVILDCCFASAAATKGRNASGRSYQLLAASGDKEYTPEPGPRSFTTALCDSFEELLRDHAGQKFSLDEIVENINRKRKPACFKWDRLRTYKWPLYLGRLDTTPAREEAFKHEKHEKSSLLIRMSLEDDDLEDERIENLAKSLHSALQKSKIGVRRMIWEGMVVTEKDTPQISGTDDKTHTPCTLEASDTASEDRGPRVENEVSVRSPHIASSTSTSDCPQKIENSLNRKREACSQLYKAANDRPTGSTTRRIGKMLIIAIVMLLTDLLLSACYDVHILDIALRREQSR